MVGCTNCSVDSCNITLIYTNTEFPIHEMHQKKKRHTVIRISGTAATGIKMLAKLANLNHCAVPFLGRVAAYLCWYYSTGIETCMARKDRKRYKDIYLVFTVINDMFKSYALY